MFRVLFLIFTVLFIENFYTSTTAFSASLEELVHKAESNDFKLRSLKHKVKAREYQIQQVISQYKPQLSFSTYFGWQEYKPYYGGLIKQKLKYYYLTLKQPVYRPEIISKLKQTKIYKKIDTLKVQQEKQYIRYFLLTTMLHLAYAKRKVELYTKLLSFEKEKYREALKLKDKEFISKEDFLRVEKEYEDAYISFKDAQIELDSFVSSLRNLLGSTDYQNLVSPLNEELEIKNLGLTLDYNAWKKDLGKNIEIKIAEKNVKIAEIEIKRRGYERYPKVDLQLSYSYASSSAISVASNDKRIALTLDFPIYQGGYVSALKLEALELKKAAFEDLKQIKKEKSMQLDDSWHKLKQAEEKIKNLKRKLLNDYKIYKVIKKALEKGLKTEIDLKNQEVEIVRDKILLNEEVHTFSTAYVELLYLTSNLDFKNIKKLNCFLSPR
ncbi:outer membrane efflux protein [Desulfurobacterium thermolithotrophum DSM 11699]|uniref:Outer membrane efflux protein n=1 Tax=Desulfurobacterium thermolithotrophum (strain DSM 11699 / BSA) TaxID=868864 RepID=F0S178_DESTD|nr:outer membrane efflux protein [Desulfurobacterium thermolithotrophum DSM 11699]